MYVHKYSHNSSSRELYTYLREREREREREKPPVYGLRISISPRIWKPTNAIEKAECNIYLDDVSFGHQHAKKRQDFSLSKKRYSTLKGIWKDDDETS